MERKPKKVVGIAWCGTYKSGELGWLLPPYLDSRTKLSLEQKHVLSPENHSHYPADFYRVKITIEAVRDKKGNLIVKRNARRVEPAPGDSGAGEDKP